MAKQNENELLRLIRKAAGTFEKDYIRYFIGVILPYTQNDILYKTCTVQEISGTAITNINFFGPDSSGNPIDQITQNNYNTSINQPLIHYDVMLIPNITNGNVKLPTVGSEVVVLCCDKQPALIIQYGAVSNSSTSYQYTPPSPSPSTPSSQTIVNTGATASITTVSDTTNNTNVKADIDLSYVMHGYTRGLADTAQYKATHRIDTFGHTLAVIDESGLSTTIIQDSTNISIATGTGAQINLNNMMSIKNDTADMKKILNDIMTYITTINTALSIVNPNVEQTIIDINSLLY